MNLAQRWRWWRERRRHHPPDDVHRAGELAEQRLAKIARAAGKANGWQVFESVRIPDPEQGGKREIDLVVVGGNTVLVVEQKHWSGSFEINENEEFIQFRKNGTVHNHSTVHQRIQRKARMLERLHVDRVGTKANLTFQVMLAFTNRNLAWPNSVHELDCLVSDEKGMIALLEGEHPGETNLDVLETMAGFGTWDEVHLNGGLIRKGDVLDLGLGHDVAGWMSTRADEAKATVAHARSLLSLLRERPTSVTWGHGQQRLKADVPYGAMLKMHVVGQESPEEIPWSTVQGVLLSKPERWND